MTDILKRLKAATGPSRELDARIHQALFPDQQIMINGGSVRHKMPAQYSTIATISIDTWQGDFEGLASMFFTERYTASIDAALALVDRMLPGHDYILGHTNEGLTIHAQLGPNEMCFGETLPLAILTALFTALEAKGCQS
jgi:hypothetical protein